MDEGENRQVVIGVDTYKDLHVAAALDSLDVQLGQLLIPALRTARAVGPGVWVNRPGFPGDSIA